MTDQESSLFAYSFYNLFQSIDSFNIHVKLNETKYRFDFFKQFL